MVGKELLNISRKTGTITELGQDHCLNKLFFKTHCYENKVAGKDWSKISAYQIADKGFVPRICKQPPKVNKKTSDPLENEQISEPMFQQK